MSTNSLLHPIKLVAMKTGLSTHLIRVWERRYGAVSPERTGTHRRMYSEGEIERLKLLGRLTESGHSIGNIATLDVGALRALVMDKSDLKETNASDRLRMGRREMGRQFVEGAVTAMVDLNQEAMERTLQEASVALGQRGMLLHVISPLAEEIGILWHDGMIGVAHEHFASAILRTFLANMSRPFAPNETSPHIVTATPTRQMHEIGAMIVTAASVAMGWQATYLGACISPLEIAGALSQRPAQVVGLSIVFPPDDPVVSREIVQLGQLLPEGVALIVGGRTAPSYQKAIDEAGAIVTGSLEEFMDQLQGIRAA